MTTGVLQNHVSTSGLENCNQRVVLHDVDWEGYEAMLVVIGDGHVRVTYDDGEMELMSPSNFHEIVKSTLRRVLEAYAESKGIEVDGFGSTTFRRKDLKKGLEPDECYYIARAREVIGKKELDLRKDPPPDLAIEIDISPARVERQPIYAALGVPEIWRFDGQELHCLHRRGRVKNAEYVTAERSLSFPDLVVAELNQFVTIGLNESQSAAIRALRKWMKS